jgi:hypothetical protein
MQAVSPAVAEHRGISKGRMSLATAKVFLHYKDKPGGEWINEERNFVRLPCVGEYVALSSGSALRVYAVVHCPFEAANFEAEVFTSSVPSMADAIAAGKPLPI